MDAFQTLTQTPFAALSQLDIAEAEDRGFYDDLDGEPVECDHRHFPDGTNVGKPGWGRASGRFIPIDKVAGGRRTSR